MEFSPQSHWHSFFKWLAEQSIAGHLLTRACKTPLHLEPTHNTVGVAMTLLVTGESFPNWWHLPEGQFCDNTSAARSSLYSALSDELCRVTQGIATADVCLHLILPQKYLYFFGNQEEAAGHIPAWLQKKRSGAVPLCLPHSLEQLLLLTPCAQLILVRFWTCISLPCHLHQGMWELPGGIWQSSASSHNPTRGLHY